MFVAKLVNFLLLICSLFRLFFRVSVYLSLFFFFSKSTKNMPDNNILKSIHRLLLYFYVAIHNILVYSLHTLKAIQFSKTTLIILDIYVWFFQILDPLRILYYSLVYISIIYLNLWTFKKHSRKIFCDCLNSNIVFPVFFVIISESFGFIISIAT